MYYSDYYNNAGYGHDLASSVAGVAVWTVVAFILAIIGGVLVYFLFIKNDAKLSKGWQKLKDLLDFKIMLIEPILKIVYLVLTIFVVLVSFALISTSFIAFLLTLLLGPILIRIIYELILINIMIWKNTRDINSKLGTTKKEEAKKETKKEKETK